MKWLLSLLLLAGCSGMQHSESTRVRESNASADPISRYSHQRLFPPPKLTPWTRASYPWEERHIGDLPRISREFFRCRGQKSHPVKMGKNRFGDPIAHFDCDGSESHGLPMRNGEEFIYPALIELLNHLQTTFNKQVVITSGHRCPKHNRYIGGTSKSKHLVGGEVDFYVKGLENKPGVVARALMEYYKNRHTGHPEYTTFIHNTSGWSNKEVIIRIHETPHGRLLDNAFDHPHLTLELRHDRDRNRRVVYNWHTAITFPRY